MSTYGVGQYGSGTYGNPGGVQPKPIIYQQIWIVEERKKGEPRKGRRVVKKIKRQLQQAVEAVEAAKQSQQRQEELSRQQEALRLAEQEIALSFDLFTLELQKLELEKAAQAYQAKVRFEQYVRQEYEKAVRLYQEELIRKEKERQIREQEELEQLQMLLDYLMAEA